MSDNAEFDVEQCATASDAGVAYAAAHPHERAVDAIREGIRRWHEQNGTKP